MCTVHQNRVSDFSRTENGYLIRPISYFSHHAQLPPSLPLVPSEKSCVQSGHSSPERSRCPISAGVEAVLPSSQREPGQAVILHVGQQGENGPCVFSVGAGTPSPERASDCLWPPGPKLSFGLTPSHLTWGALLALFPAQSAHFSPQILFPSLRPTLCAKKDDPVAMPANQGLGKDKTGQGWSLARGRVVPPLPSRNVESGSVIRDNSVTVLNICIGSFREG